MTFDGVSAVQARIAQIQALVSSAAPTSSTGTSAPASTTSADFASLLQEAMASNAGADPLSSSSAGASTSDPLAALTGSGAGSSSISGLVSQLVQSGQLGQLAGGATPGAGTVSGSTTAQQFLNEALAQQGKPYVQKVTDVNDPNPASFDCEGLVKWAAAHVGITMPSGATAQYLYCRDHGTTMSVQQALHTPGALLFHFSHEPKNGNDIPADGHVAISLGDGVHTMEAHGRAYGTNVFANAAGRPFDFAGMIPGM